MPDNNRWLLSETRTRPLLRQRSLVRKANPVLCHPAHSLQCRWIFRWCVRQTETVNSSLI